MKVLLVQRGGVNEARGEGWRGDRSSAEARGQVQEKLKEGEEDGEDKNREGTDGGDQKDVTNDGHSF